MQNLGSKISPHPRPFEEIQFTTKSELVYQSLRESIVSGRLAPGESIDQESVAAAFGVSRMPLRQALLKLEAGNLIEFEPHRTAVVAPLSLHHIEEVYALRGAIEPMLARVAVARLSEADCDAMAVLEEEMIAAVAGHEMVRFVERDRRFHERLYAATGYVRAMQDMERLRDLSDRYIAFFAFHERRAEGSLRDHAKILQACRAGDTEGVARLVERHVRQGADVLIEAVKAASEADAGAIGDARATRRHG